MSLSASLDADVTSQRVTFVLHVRNEGTNPVDLQFPTAQTVEVTVNDEDDETVWQYHEDRMFAQRVSTVSLEPGEDMILDATWEDPPPGTYRAIARVAATPSASATAGFRVDGTA